MTGGGGEFRPPVNGGEFLLQLLKNPPLHPNEPQQQQQQQQPQQPSSVILTHDPAVAAVGPTLPIPFPSLFQSNGLTPPWPHHHHRHSPPPSFAPHNFFLQNPNPNPNSNPNLNLNFASESSSGLNQAHIQRHNIQFSGNSLGDDARKLGVLGNNSKAGLAHQQEQKDLIFGSLRGNEGLLNGNFSENLLVSHKGKGKLQTSLLKEGGEGMEGGLGNTRRLNGEAEFQQKSVHLDRDSQGNLSISRDRGQERSGCNSSGAGNWSKQGNNGHNYRAAVPPPGFAGMTVGNREYANRMRSFEQTGEKSRKNFKESRYQNNKGDSERRFLSKNGKNEGFDRNRRVSDQLVCPAPLPGSNLRSVSASDIEESMMELHGGENCETGEALGIGMRESMRRDGHKGQSDLDDLEEMLVESVVLKDESDDKSGKKKFRGPRDKDYRTDKRGQSLLGQRMRYLKRQIVCRGDIGRLSAPFLAIYESLIPAEEEKAKQKQLLALLENIVSKEWPDARLYLYGSCANSFGFSKSDIDVCLTIDEADLSKSDVLLKLADMLQSDSLQNVQALTRARVPIVKLMDPATGISCDICVNNVLAVVNTKLLLDYAEIDVRLRQLAFIVKHWAKSRGINETYQGTLSSYAYVLMCIHFLQHRRPSILPCLQEMKATYSVTVDNVECTYFDQVENLVGFGSRNGESIAQLVWGFFNYWAYIHDYANTVISVRTGNILSKHSKDWTRRIGNDRHLICIEDPFEVSHDLGRVVDKYSIKVLREEFERAAEVVQYDPNPCSKLFEPYIPT